MKHRLLFRGLILSLCTFMSHSLMAYDFESGGVYYNITDAENLKAEVTFKTDSYNSYSGIVEIPDSVSYNEQSYAVVGIGTRAFLNCIGLRGVKIPNHVSYIGQEAFENCIGLKSITCKAVDPPTSAYGSFYNVDKTIPVYVPKDAIESYQAADYWKEFTNIRELYGEDTDINASSDIIYMKPATGRLGSTVSLPILMKNSSEVTGYQFEIELPVGFSIAKDEYEDLVVDLSDERTTARKHNIFEVTELSNGRVQVLCSSSYNSTYAVGDGVIVEMTLKINDDVEEGDYAICLKNIAISDIGSNVTRIESVKSTITVVSYSLGDANGDGSIDVGDITAIVSRIQENAPASFVEKAADVNEDGNIDVGDITAVVTLIKEQANATAPAVRMLRPSLKKAAKAANATVDISAQSNVIFMPPVTIQPGEEVTASLMMNNVDNICGYQLEFKLPEGITIPQDEDEYYLVDISKKRTTARKHNIFELTKLSNGNIQLLCSSTTNAIFSGNSGEVATLSLLADASLAQGTYEIELVDVRLSHTDSHVDHVGDVPAYAICEEYSRTVSTDWGTVVLPYSTQSTEEVQLYTLESTDLANGVLTVEPVATVSANTPCIFKRLDSEATTVSFPVLAEGFASEVTVSAKTDVEDWTFKGSYYNRTLTPEASLNIYYIAEDQFWYANQAFEVGAFRAWFETPVAGAGCFRIHGSEEETTGIEDMQARGAKTSEVYDLFGRKQQGLQRGTMNIINGKIKVVK